jgi:hypothetical protein
VTRRDRTVIAIVCSLVAVVGAWLLVIQPKRDQASKLGNEVTAAQTQLATARAQIVAGEAARSSFSSNYAQLVRLGEAVPQDDNVPSLIYQLQNAASGARVDFRSLQLTPGSGGAAPAPAPAPAPSSSSTTTSSSTPTATSTPASTAASSPASTSPSTGATGSLPPGAAVGPAGFPSELFTFTFRGNFFHLADFFQRMERFVVATNKHVSVSGRLMTLNAINLGPGPQGFPQIDATISATTYLVPASQGLTAGATPLGPSAGASGQAVSTSAASSAAAPAVATPPVP